MLLSHHTHNSNSSSNNYDNNDNDNNNYNGQEVYHVVSTTYIVYTSTLFPYLVG